MIFLIGAETVTSSDAYRRKAHECFLIAAGVANTKERLVLLEMAQKWMRLAERRDTRANDPDEQVGGASS
jgi:hypothetical protein